MVTLLKIAGIEYWVQMLFYFTPVNYGCTPSVDPTLNTENKIDRAVF